MSQVERMLVLIKPDGVARGLVGQTIARHGATEVVRGINGSTDSAAAAPGAIRGDFSRYENRNLVHASDSPQSAAREVELRFGGLG